jgi:hypothetical protein
MRKAELPAEERAALDEAGLTERADPNGARGQMRSSLTNPPVFRHLRSNPMDDETPMPAIIHFSQSPDGTIIPYRAFTRGAQENHGFVDTRGRPDLAAGIAEGAGSAALRALLVLAASPQSAVFTAGCDLGAHHDKAAPPDKAFVAGGYMQFLRRDYANAPAAAWKFWSDAVASAIAAQCGQARWQAEFMLKEAHLTLDGFSGLTQSALVNFWAMAASPSLAEASRERLIAAVSTGVKTSGFPPL